MEENLYKILKKIQNKEISNLYSEEIKISDFFKKDKEGISFLEHCLINEINISYKMENEFGKYIEIIELYIKYKKSIYNFDIPEEILFSNYKNARVIDFIIENKKLNQNVMKNITNIEIIDILIETDNTYYLTYLSDEIIDNLLTFKEDGSYEIEKYFDNKVISNLIEKIKDSESIINICTKTNRYDLLKYANENVLMYKIDNNKTLLMDLVEKNIIPDKLKNIPDNEIFIKYLYENNYIDYLKNADEEVLLTQINGGKTILENLLEKDYLEKIEFSIWKKETIKTLYKYNKLELIKNISLNNFLNTNIKEMFENDKLEDISLLEFLLNKGINPLENSYDINDENFIKVLLKTGYLNFLIKKSNDNILLTKIDDTKIVLDLIIKDKKISKIKEFKTIEIAKKLYEGERLDLLVYAQPNLLMEKVDSNYTFLDYLLKEIKNKTVNFKVIDFNLYQLSVEELAKFYIILAKNDMIPYAKELTEKELLKTKNGERLIEKLLDLDSDLTVNKILSDEVKTNIDIVVILKSRGIIQDEVEIPLKDKEKINNYLEEFNQSVGIGPVKEEGEILINRLYELFINDEKSDKKLVYALVSTYKDILLINYDIGVKELRHLINIKENNFDSFIYINEEEGAFFLPNEGYINCENTNYNTLIHETGHALHYYIADEKIPENYFDIINRIRLNHETLKKVELYSKKFHELRDRIYKLAEDKYKEYFKNYYTEEKKKEIEEFLNKSLNEKKAEFKDLGLDEDLLNTILENKFILDEYIKQEKEVYIREYADNVLRNEFGAFICIGDIIDAVYIGEFKSKILKNDNEEFIDSAYGHGIPYFSIDNKGFCEMVANYGVIIKSKEREEILPLLKSIVGDELYNLLNDFYYNNIINAEYNLESKKNL